MIPADADLPQFLTVGEVAATLRVSRATIYRLVAAGALSGARIGKSVRVPRHAVDEFLRQQAHGPADPLDDRPPTQAG